jgi:plasmid stability protein
MSAKTENLTTIYLPREIKSRIAIRAKERGLSLSSHIRQLCLAELSRAEKRSTKKAATVTA